MTDRNTASRKASPLCRRGFLRVGAAALAAASLADPVNAFAHITNAVAPPLEPVRQLSLFNLNTRERVSVSYWTEGRYIVDALRQISHVLRDHHDGSVHAIDPRLVDVMYGVFRMTGGCGPVNVVCGYRSPRTNARLHAHHRGVAGHSLHMRGMAVDIRMPECGLNALHQAALALRAGGVGFYPRSDFVHVDTGPVRTWGGHGAAEDEVAEAPAWRDALLSDTPQVQQAANAGLLPPTDDVAPAIEAVTPRGRMLQGGAAGVPTPGHKPMRFALRDAAPVQSEGFWVRRKPRLSAGG